MRYKLGEHVTWNAEIAVVVRILKVWRCDVGELEEHVEFVDV